MQLVLNKKIKKMYEIAYKTWVKQMFAVNVSIKVKYTQFIIKIHITLNAIPSENKITLSTGMRASAHNAKQEHRYYYT